MSLLFLILALGGIARADLATDDRISAEVDSRVESRIRGEIEVRLVSGELEAGEMDDFAALCDRGVRDIERFIGLGREGPERIVIYLSPDVSISHTWPRYPHSPEHEARVFIDSRRIADHTAPYLHELVHAVIGNGGSMWLEEGFASWVASSVARKSGGYYAPVLSGDNEQVDREASAVFDAIDATERDRLLRLLRRPRGSPRFSNGDERREYYVLAHSFAKFLVSRIGLAPLVQVHCANDVDAMASMTGAAVEEWQREWVADLAVVKGGRAYSPSPDVVKAQD